MYTQVKRMFADEADEKAFFDALDIAKKSWKCEDPRCRSIDYKKMKSGMIFCDNCIVWKHKLCCAPISDTRFKCTDCKFEFDATPPVSSGDEVHEDSLEDSDTSTGNDDTDDENIENWN